MPVIKKGQYPVRYIEHMKGGQGRFEIEDILQTDEMHEKGRLFAIGTLEPGHSVGYHVHEEDMEICFFRRSQPWQLLDFLQDLQRTIKMSCANKQNAVSSQKSGLIHALFVCLIIKLHGFFVFVLSVCCKCFVSNHISHKTHNDSPPCCFLTLC